MSDETAATVLGIYTAIEAGAPMASHDSVRVEPGLGIPGDRYATRRGHWSDPRWKDQELTLVEAEFLERLRLPWPALRRNIVTRGVDLLDLVGLDFAVGSAVLRGARPCAPCMYIERLNRPGLFKELENRGGVRVRVIQAGTISVGDRLEVVGIADDVDEVAAAPSHA